MNIKLSPEQTWTSIKDTIQQRVGKERYNLWVKNTGLIEIENTDTVKDQKKPAALKLSKSISGSVSGTVKIGVPNLFVATWLEEKLLNEFEKAVEEVLGAPFSVRFVVDGTLYRRMRRQTVRQVKEFERKVSASVRSGLNEKHNLERMAVGDCNRIAYLSAKKIVEAPAELNNVLFVHGPDGSAKTHLLQGIAIMISSSDPESRVVYASADKFSNQFVWALKNKNLREFRKKFRNTDWLIIDDIDVLQTKKATQEEFLHCVDQLLSTGQKVVVSSSMHPSKLRLRSRLVGRLLSGMTAAVTLPDFNTRVNILKKLCEDLSDNTRSAFSDELLKHIARKFHGNTRELVGAFIQLGAYVSLLPGNGNRQLTKRAADKALSDLGNNKPAQIGLKEISKKTAEFFGLSENAILSSSRTRSISLPRQICMYFAKRLTPLSLAEIGKYFGGRSHSAVSSSEKRVAKLVTVDKAIADSVARIETVLKTTTG